MPRQAHGRPLQSSAPSKSAKRKPAQAKALNALETAEHQFPSEVNVRQHRLGQVEDDPDEPSSRADADERSSKRRKVANDQPESDEAEEGSDLDGNQWHVGIDNEDDDSDIDSDEAFGESDEERFAGFTFRGTEEKQGSSRNRKRINKLSSKSMNLSEDPENDSDTSEQSNDEGLGEDAVDLATAFDMNVEEDHRDEERAKRKAKLGSDSNSTKHDLLEGEGRGGESGDSKESEESEDDDQASEFSVSDDDNGDHNRLRTFVDSLTTAEATKPSRQIRDSRGLAAKPSEFGLGVSNISTADLMQYIKDPAQRQSLKIIEAGEKEDPSAYKGGIPGKLAAPLAKRQQDRLDRMAAYDKSKETLERWIDTVKQNRRAEHVSFPLPDPELQSALGKQTLKPTLYDLPQTELESKIQEIMRESGMGGQQAGSIEERERAFEELQEKKVPIEEIQARRAELRAQRELMFREEIRARRIKKIKSKSYRRVHRKERDRNEAQERERLLAAGVLNSDDERERSDRKRAEERMGARHRESKWAKAVKSSGKGKWNEDARTGVSDLARRDEELRKRIQGREIKDSDASDSESESDVEYSDEDPHGMDRRLAELQPTAHTFSTSKLTSMAFMQRAERAKRAQNDEDIRNLRRSIRGQEPNLTDSEEDIIQENGRLKFGAPVSEHKDQKKSRSGKNELEARLSEDEEEDAEEDDYHQMKASLTPAPASKSAASKPQTFGIANNSIAKSTSKAPANGNVLGTSAANHLARPSSQTLNAKDEPSNSYTSSSESEEESHRDAQAQQAMAIFGEDFAGDDQTLQDFQKEKKETIEDEGDKTIDNTLPGWGNWAGAGISKRELKKGKGRFLTTVKGINPEKRRDAKLDRVIVNEKLVKKNGKYRATELPHPFESRAQYERSLRLPMGPEWSTRNHFQDSIKPRVLVKQGTIIKPMARPLV